MSLSYLFSEADWAASNAMNGVLLLLINLANLGVKGLNLCVSYQVILSSSVLIKVGLWAIVRGPNVYV